MNCPNCSKEMTSMTLEAHLSDPVDIDICMPCQALWFDRYESLKLEAGSAARLKTMIEEQASAAKPQYIASLSCPRCHAPLHFTHDMQADTRFSYWRCEPHGRFITFFDFLKEKKFIRELSRKQLDDLRQQLGAINCANCGAPIDLGKGSTCDYCGSPIPMLASYLNEEQRR
jgi:Zn-finger nucleic acid-binding protein